MVFSSVSFVTFFLFVFALYWLFGALPISRERIGRIRVIFLLICSYFFYGCWSARLLFLIAFSTLIDFQVGARLPGAKSVRQKKYLLWTSICLNLGLLGIFKYANFFAQSAQDLLSVMGVETDPILLNIILPLGISFYTFQSMSYTIDIYRGKIEPEPKLLNFALFISFFPQLVAGPIVRASDFLWQLKEDHRLGDVNFDRGIEMIIRGFVKKVLVADVIAIFVDQVFADAGSYGTINTWIAVVSYSMQIYCDFSGYSDIAIGLAALLGIRLPQNFNFPLMARGLIDLWRRWHISLSTWLRDYVYISLGGNRGGELKTYRNLFATMLLSGLWHGASYSFILHGGLHGIFLVSELTGRQYIPAVKRYVPEIVRTVLSIIVTIALFSATLVFFRHQPFSVSLGMARTLVTWVPDTSIAIPYYTGVLVALGYFTHAMGEMMKNVTSERILWTLRLVRPLRFCALALLIIIGSESHEQPFVYFQF